MPAGQALPLELASRGEGPLSRESLAEADGARLARRFSWTPFSECAPMEPSKTIGANILIAKATAASGQDHDGEDDGVIRRVTTLKVAPECSARKIAIIRVIQEEWRRVLPLAFQWVWGDFLAGRGPIKLRQPASGPGSEFPKTKLVTEQKKTMAAAIEGQAKGWSTSFQKLVKRGLMADSILAGREPEAPAKGEDQSLAAKRERLEELRRKLRKGAEPFESDFEKAKRRNAANKALLHELLWVNSMAAWTVAYVNQVDRLETVVRERKEDEARKFAKLVAEAAAAGLPAPEAATPKKRLEALSPQASRIMRKLVRRRIERARLPDPSNIALTFGGDSAKMSERGKGSTKSKFAARWLTISTLEFKGKRPGKQNRRGVTSKVKRVRISLPIMGSAHEERLGGKIKKTYKLAERNGEWFVTEFREIEPEPWKEHRVHTLALDLGLRNLIATSEGDLLGVDFMDRLLKYDARISKIQAGLQRAGVKKFSSCKRYRREFKKVVGFIKTTVETLVKQIVSKWQPKRIAIERLAFTKKKEGGLGRTLNRMVRRFGQGYFRRALEAASQKHGFELVEVNPAHTSQMCSSCGFVHRANRKGNRFHCLACGREAHADVNAARNLKGRSLRVGGPGLTAPPGGPTLVPVVKHGVSISRERLDAWRVRALMTWLLRMERRLIEASRNPDAPKSARAVDGARAGLEILSLKRGSSPKRLARQRGKGRLARPPCHQALSLSDLLKKIQAIKSGNAFFT